eukprot:474147_1
MAVFMNRQKTSSKVTIATPSSEKRQSLYQPPLNTHSKNISIISDIGNASLSQLMKPPDPGSTDHEPRRDFLHIVKASNSPTTNAYFSFDSDTNHTLQDDNNSNHSDSNELLLDIEYTPTHKQTDNKQRYYSLDDALKSLQFGRFDYILIFIVSVIYFSVAIQARASMFLLQSSIPTCMKYTHLSID